MANFEAPLVSNKITIWKHQHLIFLKIFIYLWLCWGFVEVYKLSLVVVSEGVGLFFATVCELLAVVASLVAEHRPQVHRFQQLWCTGLAATQYVGSSQTREAPDTLYF